MKQMMISNVILALLVFLPQARAALPSLHRHHRSLRVPASRQNITALTQTASFDEPHPLGCGVTEKVTSSSDQRLVCPKECPLFAKNKHDDDWCSFECVEATSEECAAHNEKAPVPDKELGFCRACKVDGCKTCMRNGKDECKVCNRGFRLMPDGSCKSKMTYVWMCLFVILGLLFVVAVAWLVELFFRPVCNEEGLKRGLAMRSRAKLHMSEKDVEDMQRELAEINGEEIQPQQRFRRQLWPLTTDLCSTNVAGPGIVLQFNFQRMLIFWGFCIGVGWTILALTVDTDLFILGTRRAKTPRQNCWVVSWGYEVQHALMWTKVLFVLICYVCSFVGSILFGIYQLRLWQRMDMRMDTHKDYCAICTGLPQIPGSVRVEEELQTLIKQTTGETVVGVSACWDMKDKEELVMALIEQELEDREYPGSVDSMPVTPRPKHNCCGFRYVLHKIEAGFLSPVVQRIITKGRKKGFPERHKNPAKQAVDEAEGTQTRAIEITEVDMSEELGALQTCNQAFVVFETEKSRDLAIQRTKDQGGLAYMDQSLALEPAHCEPEAVVWKNMHNKTFWGKLKTLGFGVGVIVVALNFWLWCFYVPYGYFVMSFNYKYGQEPSFVQSMTFTMVVVLGNVLMYLVCAEVSDRVGFRYIEDREVCYLLLYSFACIFNVVLDLVVAYYIAYNMMKGIGMKTYHGVKLEDLTSFTAIFESYAMQRELGHTLMAYNFPSTFLIPFLAEPIATIYLPYKLMALIVRSHATINGPASEAYLMSTPMDLSRYADVLLNAILAVIVFWFPGGLNLKMFFGLAGSHLYIMVYDHWRVLQSIPRCDYHEMIVDWWAQWMLCIPCGLMLSCLVFKANCEENLMAYLKGTNWHGDNGYFSSCDESWRLTGKCTAVFILHVIVHTLVLVFVVPKFGVVKTTEEEERVKQTFKETAMQRPFSWFSTNPVHCLRSQYVYNHSPPCDYCVVGKEHMLRKNEAIGCYFEDQKSLEEDYMNLWAEAKKTLRQESRIIKGKFSPKNRRTRSGTASSQTSRGTSVCQSPRGQPSSSPSKGAPQAEEDTTKYPKRR